MSEAQTITKDSVQHKLSSNSYTNFVAKALDNAGCNTAVFINKGFSGSLKPQTQHTYQKDKCIEYTQCSRALNYTA